MSKEEIKASEILLIYEANQCNPNGDPNSENRPRIDPVTQRNYVTDVRLKRFFRDFVVDTQGRDHIYVTTVGGKAVTPEQRLGDLKKADSGQYIDMLRSFIDVRLFGAVLPVKESSGGKDRGKKKGETESGLEDNDALEGKQQTSETKEVSQHITGPVQFAPGYSLHKVELMNEVSQITSHFVGREKGGEVEHGTFGRDWRVYYSLIAFYGCINPVRAKDSGLAYKDVKRLDNWLWEGLTKESLTRSKIGHYPHLYLRVEYNKDTYLGDLRRFIDEDMTSENVRSLSDVKIGFGRLQSELRKLEDRIDRLYINESDEFASKFGVKNLFGGVFRGKVSALPHNDNLDL